MQHSIARRIAVAIASVLPLLAAAAPLPAYRDFRDWTVACDNAGDCEARGFTEGSEDRITLRLVRTAGAASVPTLTLYGLAPAPGSELRFDDVAWRPPGDSASSRQGTDADGEPQTELTLRGLGAVRAFAGHAHRATRISSGDRDGSVAGFDAAILFIDDVQGRVGTPTAIARAGASKAHVPDGHPLPVVHARPLPPDALDNAAARRYVAGLSVSGLDCDAPQDDDMPTVTSINPDEVIALVACHRGAYQTAYAVFRGPRNNPQRAHPLDLPYPPGVGGDAGILVEPTLVSATGRLSMFSKGRGLADCGESGEWAFDGRGFALVSYTKLDRCGWPEPGDFPVLWRATVAREAAR